MIDYDLLHDELRKLEARVLNPSTLPSFPARTEIRTWSVQNPSQVQTYGLDESTQEKKLPVIVALGGNYTQGTQKVPRDSGHKDAVEDDLRPARKNLIKGLSEYAKPKSAWNSKSAASSDSLDVLRGFHFVMTNFCIWITKDSWQNTRPHRRADLLENNPPFGSRSVSSTNWLHLTELAKKLQKEDVIWVGHGMHCEVFALFRQFIMRSIPSAKWILMPNLSYYYDYQKWPFPD